MLNKTTPFVSAAALALALLLSALPATAAGPVLPSWNDGAARKAIVDFVARVTKPGGPEFVPPSERIAVFDNDGTLWPEQPMYVQLAFILDRIKALAPDHPEWKMLEPFSVALAGDAASLGDGGAKTLMDLVAVTHGGMSTSAFDGLVRSWLATARHPRFDRPYTELAYAPMLELLAYLRANGFKTFIASGGGQDFIRAFAEPTYGIPPEQVIGSRAKQIYEVLPNGPAIQRQPKVEFLDDKAGKPVGIHQAIGRRPIAAFGNSDGDFEMLEWTTSGPGARLGLLVHHDDADREWAYDRQSHFGRLAKALDEAPARHWVVASMKWDWKQVFTFKTVAPKP